MSDPRWRLQEMLGKADEQRTAEAWEHRAQLMALWYIAMGESPDPKNCARAALGLPLEHPSWPDVAASLEEDDALPF